MTVPPLWHYTCDHGRAAIGDIGRLVPARSLQPDGAPDYWTAHLVWLTDLAIPDRNALGLTMHLVTCDRMAYRYRVTDTVDVVPWWLLRRELPGPMTAEIETAHGSTPMHWWVSTRPVPAVFAPVDN